MGGGGFSEHLYCEGITLRLKGQVKLSDDSDVGALRFELANRLLQLFYGLFVCREESTRVDKMNERECARSMQSPNTTTTMPPPCPAPAPFLPVRRRERAPQYCGSARCPPGAPRDARGLGPRFCLRLHEERAVGGRRHVRDPHCWPAG